MNGYPKYRNASGAWVDAQVMTREIGVGRPATEQNNDPTNQRTHDIRVLTIRTHVFNLPNGSPCATQQEVQDDVSALRERMAQATISVTWDGVMNAIALPADGSLDNGLTVSNSPFQMFNAGELHIVSANVIDSVLDVFYLDGVEHQGTPRHGVAYIHSMNETQNPAGHNFIVMNAHDINGADSGLFTLGHEVMHILLDTGHRAHPLPLPWDPSTALFEAGAAGEQSNTIGGRKRIGPNWETTVNDPNGAVAGDNDTFIIRDHAEALP